MQPQRPNQSPRISRARQRLHEQQTKLYGQDVKMRSLLFNLPDRFGKLPSLLLTGLTLAVLALLVDVRPERVSSGVQDDRCQTVVNNEAVLSRDELTALLSIPERETMASIRAVVDQPYCQLPDLELRVGAIARREAYPLEFDPETWLIILYEGDEYAGYDFRFVR